MSRRTQYVGLSPASKEFINSHNHTVIAEWKMYIGITGEPVMGKIYEVEFETSGITNTFAEVEQITIWAGGPIIHTALRDISTGELYFPWLKSELTVQ